MTELADIFGVEQFKETNSDTRGRGAEKNPTSKRISFEIDGEAAEIAH